jgi:hypothetical protein
MAIVVAAVTIMDGAEDGAITTAGAEDMVMVVTKFD